MRIFKRDSSRYYWYEFIFGGRRYQESSGFTNKIAAQRTGEIRRTRLAEGRAGITRKKTIPMFRNFAEQFLETAQLECKPKTHVFYQDRIRQLLPWFGAKRLDEIIAPAIREFKESRLKQGRRGTTVNRDLGTLRRVLAVAVKDGILQSSPFFARQIEFLPENGCDRVVSLSEEKKYLEAACPLLRDFATIILEMGLRPEEVFELHTLHMHVGVRPPYVHIPGGKTPKARRDIPITAQAMPVLHTRLARAKSGYLFPQRVGTGFNYDRAMTDLHHAHERALKTSGIEPTFRIYDLRHTYGTRAIEAGMNPLTLAKLMGHADLKTTQRYVHLSKQHLEGAQRQMEEFRAKLEIADAEQRTREQGGAESAQWRN